MLSRLRKHNGQSTLEYAILIIIILAAILSLQTYIKRGIGGRLKTATDDIGEQYSQATPANFYKHVTTTTNTTDTSLGGQANSAYRANKVTNSETRIGTNADSEYWGK
ncbi:MAG: hypothetical protein HQL16_07895 [Candidatus Omnitrophica bacterium]|nr:hypothetical protein [Candidatus Omnitrophota bacterium]